MKRLILPLTLLFLLIFSGCVGVEQEVDQPKEVVRDAEGNQGSAPLTPAPLDDSTTSGPVDENGGVTEEDGLTSYFEGELAFDYPERYTLEEGGMAELLVVRGENARLEIFPIGVERTDVEEPQEKYEVGRDVVGYNVWLYYSNEEAGGEAREIYESIVVLQSYRNGANAFTMYFPQDWYFNFEQNDTNCMSPYEKGPIANGEDCKNAMIQIHVLDSLEAAMTYAKQIPVDLGGSVSITDDAYPVGDSKIDVVVYSADAVPDGGKVYVFELNGRGLAVDLTDFEYADITEDILVWSFGL